MAHTQPVKGGPWFSTPGKPGDRTLEQQLMGLDPLFAEIEGKTVLDVGCAEGLISLECAKRGAKFVFGLEIRPAAVVIANKAAMHFGVSAKARFLVSDANGYLARGSDDIVLMLAVLHKLRDPSAVCRRIAAAARDLVVIRLPPNANGMILDARSDFAPHNIDYVMHESGFVLEQQGPSGPFDEWMGYYRRVK